MRHAMAMSRAWKKSHAESFSWPRIAVATGVSSCSSPDACLHEAAVLWLVNVAANERLVVIRLGDAREIVVEDHLGDSGGHLDLGFQDVRLRREEQALLHLRPRHLIGEGGRGLDE